MLIRQVVRSGAVLRKTLEEEPLLYHKIRGSERRPRASEGSGFARNAGAKDQIYPGRPVFFSPQMRRDSDRSTVEADLRVPLKFRSGHKRYSRYSWRCHQ